MQRIKITTK